MCRSQQLSGLNNCRNKTHHFLQIPHDFKTLKLHARLLIFCNNIPNFSSGKFVAEKNRLCCNCIISKVVWKSGFCENVVLFSATDSIIFMGPFSSQMTDTFPTQVESALIVSPYVENIMIHADSLYNYCVALVVASQHTLEGWASKKGIQYSDFADLCQKGETLKEVSNSLLKVLPVFLQCMHTT